MPLSVPRLVRAISGLDSVGLLALMIVIVLPFAHASEPPRIVQVDGRYALMVNGHPYLVLGGQIHNSSSWPSELPQVWKAMIALHANTVEAPVYWEQFEPQEGHFDYSNIDQLVEGARAHDLHVVLLWFGTWKNGNNHYVPGWVKSDTKRYPRVIRQDGEPIDVLSPLGKNTLEADKTAFVALMRHLKQIDGEQHTVLLIQVENESGNIGSVRDNSPEANRLFAGQVPTDLLAATHKSAGTWHDVFLADADEIFQLYYQAKYINTIAAAGKAEFSIPYYINVWIDYPAPQPPQRQLDLPGIAYPSGGAVQKFVGLWRTLAPSIDIIGPDIYSDNSLFYREIIRTYHRPNNPLWIPETGRSDSFAKFFFYAIGNGALGFSPFGIDEVDENVLGDERWTAHARNFALIRPIDREVAEFEFKGKLETAVEETGQTTQELDFGDWKATVSFGFPQQNGRPAPGTKDAHGVAVVAQLGPDEFLVTGVDVSVVFHLPGKLPWIRSQILTAEQGTYENGVWKTFRILNGDETDRGLRFHDKPKYVRLRMMRF
ncbi:MAG: GH35 family beta-galactosidase [Acidobacteriaceae bacterium]